MKNFIISILTLCIIFIVSCSNISSNKNTEYIDKKVIDTQNIEFKPIELNIKPLYPNSCCFLDSLFFVAEQISVVKQNFYKVYYQDSLLLEFGNIGQGANDFIIPFLVSKGKENCKAINIVDVYKYWQISIDSNFTDKIIELHLPKEFNMLSNVLLYNDTTIIVAQTGEYQLQYYNKKTGDVLDFNYYDIPNKYKDLSKTSLNMQLFQSVCSSNDKFIVIVYENYKMIDIVSIKDMKLYKRLYFKDYDINNFDIEDNSLVYNDNYLIYFTSVVAYQDCFYALCWNDKYNDVSKGKVNSIIFQIDYEGNIQNIYKTDMAIFSFTIRDNEIYAIGVNRSENELELYKGLLKY